MGKNVLCVSAATWFIEKAQYSGKSLQRCRNWGILQSTRKYRIYVNYYLFFDAVTVHNDT
jgi:hypothetical protein